MIVFIIKKSKELFFALFCFITTINLVKLLIFKYEKTRNNEIYK